MKGSEAGANFQVIINFLNSAENVVGGLGGTVLVGSGLQVTLTFAFGSTVPFVLI